tara:strand:- start:5362 stop:6570 length:1209 start_codon:yes stop_codon:yes gene_type:complete
MRKKSNFNIETTFRVYLPAKIIRDKLGFKRNKEVFLGDYTVTLKNRGQQTVVTVESSDGYSDAEMGVAEVRMRLYNHLVDQGAIARVEGVLALNPDNTFFGKILKELKRGEPLGSGAEAILLEVEDRIANPDSEIDGLLNEALSHAPDNSFLKDIREKFDIGVELTDNQIQAVRNVVSRFKTQKQLVEEALSYRPNDTFLGKLKTVLDGGRSLSPKQLSVVEDIITENTSPQSDMLSDLASNGMYLSRDDYMIIRKARRSLSELTEDEAKRLRHLLYRNSSRLRGSYSKDEVREMLKKASRTAGSREEPVLSDLRGELEQNVGMLYTIVSELEDHPVVEANFSDEMDELLGSLSHLSNHGRGLGHELELTLRKIEGYQKDIRDAFDTVRMINERAKKLPNFF